MVGPINLIGQSGQLIVAKSIEKKEPPTDQFNSMRPSIVDALKKKMANERYLLFRDSIMQHLLEKGKIKRNQKAIDGLIQSYLRTS